MVPVDPANERLRIQMVSEAVLPVAFAVGEERSKKQEAIALTRTIVDRKGNTIGVLVTALRNQERGELKSGDLD